MLLLRYARARMVLDDDSSVLRGIVLSHCVTAMVLPYECHATQLSTKGTAGAEEGEPLPPSCNHPGVFHWRNTAEMSNQKVAAQLYSLHSSLFPSLSLTTTAAQRDFLWYYLVYSYLVPS